MSSETGTHVPSRGKEDIHWVRKGYFASRRRVAIVIRFHTREGAPLYVGSSPLPMTKTVYIVPEYAFSLGDLWATEFPEGWAPCADCNLDAPLAQDHVDAFLDQERCRNSQADLQQRRLLVKARMEMDFRNFLLQQLAIQQSRPFLFPRAPP